MHTPLAFPSFCFFFCPISIELFVFFFLFQAFYGTKGLLLLEKSGISRECHVCFDIVRNVVFCFIILLLLFCISVNRFCRMRLSNDGNEKWNELKWILFECELRVEKVF